MPGSGNVCGLAFLNEAFELVIKQILGQTNIHTITTKYKVALPAARNYFEHSIKRNFGNITSRAMTHGYGVPMNGAPDRPAHGLSLGLLKVPYAKIENTVFKPVVERILKLVEQQLEDTSTKSDKSPGTLLLVGGFSENPYSYSLRVGIRFFGYRSVTRSQIVSIDTRD